MPLEVLNEKQRLKSLKEMLHQHSVPAAEALIERKEDGAVQCFACGHRCLVKPGRDGVCRVRFNDNGTLLVPHGYVGALACDPIEKEAVLPRPARQRRPHLRHARLRLPLRLLPELGDQPDAPRPRRRRARAGSRRPKQLVDLAIQQRRPGRRLQLQRAADHQRMGGRCFQGSQAPAACSAPTSPTATARRRCSISSARTSRRTRSISRPSIRQQLPPARRRDGKRHRHHPRCSKQRGFWVEIVTLVVPGFSDDPDDLKRMADFLASVDPLMPWHMTAFHPDYKMTDGYRRTTVET